MKQTKTVKTIDWQSVDRIPVWAMDIKSLLASKISHEEAILVIDKIHSSSANGSDPLIELNICWRRLGGATVYDIFRRLAHFGVSPYDSMDIPSTLDMGRIIISYEGEGMPATRLEINHGTNLVKILSGEEP